MLSCTRVTRISILLVLLFGVACSDETTPPQGTQEVGVDRSTDTEPDSTSDEQAEVTVDQPTVSSPVSGARVVSPVEVVGEGEADAVVSIEVHHDDDVLGNVSTTAGSDGTFQGSVAFESGDSGAALALHVVQTTDDGTSAATVVDLVQGALPGPPTLESPQDDGYVTTPLSIRGTTEPEATVSFTLKEGDTVVVEATTTSSAVGAFSHSLEFTRPEPNTELTLAVVAENEFGVSEPTVVNVTFLSRTLSGEIQQTPHAVDGRQIYVSLLSSPNDYLDPLQTSVLTVENPEDHANEPFTFEVVPGTYYIRAFHDLPNDGEPDGYPSFSEPQSGAVEVDVDEDVTDVVVVLRDLDLGDAGGPLRSFDAYTLSEDHQNVLNDACGGVTVRFELRVNPDSDIEITPPVVRAPDGSDLELLDDGYCEDREGSSGSFDDEADDSVFTAGTSSVDEVDGGLYLLHSRFVDSDFIHIEPDTINVVPLRRHVYLTRPSGAEPVASATPTLIWAGASEGAWVLPVVFRAGGPIYGEWTQDSEYTLEEDLADDTLVSVNFLVADNDPSDGDVNAYARSGESIFIRDADGDSTVTVRGSIRNNSGLIGNINIEAYGMEGEAGKVTVDSDSDSYQMALLPQTTGETSLEAFIEVNDMHTADVSIRGLDLSEDRSGVDLVFTSVFGLVSPADAQTEVGDTPTLVWEDVSGTVPDGPFQYVVFMQEVNAEDDVPDAGWVVPGSQTSFDLSDPPVHLDMLAAFTCIEAEGVLAADGSCSADATASVTDLSGDSDWAWRVSVQVGCDFDDWVAQTDSDENDVNDFIDCFFPFDEEAGFALSPLWMFATD